jgi:hypothetical protein
MTRHRTAGSDTDLHLGVRELVDDLAKAGLDTWSAELDDVMVDGAGSTEIAMGIRWVAGRLVRSGKLSTDLRERAQAIEQLVDDALTPHGPTVDQQQLAELLSRTAALLASVGEHRRSASLERLAHRARAGDREAVVADVLGLLGHPGRLDDVVLRDPTDQADLDALRTQIRVSAQRSQR